MTTYLVQNIETFATITTFASEAAFDTWMSESTVYGIVSLDTDADGEYDYVALVAPLTSPDFDAVAPEPIPSADAELEAKLDIMFEIDTEETISIPAAPSKPRKKRKSKNTNTNTQSKGKTMKNHEILAAFITKYPGVTRTDVFQHQDLLQPLRTEAQRRAIAAGDKLEIKRWNSCINRFIRKIRRDGTDITVVGQGKSATYTIGQPDGQLELPFDDAAEARNAAINGNESAAVVEEAPIPPKQDAMRLVEEPNQSLDFESLLAQLDDDAALVLTDDQVAFKAAQEMIK